MGPGQSLQTPVDVRVGSWIGRAAPGRCPARASGSLSLPGVREAGTQPRVVSGRSARLGRPTSGTSCGRVPYRPWPGRRGVARSLPAHRYSPSVLCGHTLWQPVGTREQRGALRVPDVDRSFAVSGREGSCGVSGSSLVVRIAGTAPTLAVRCGHLRNAPAGNGGGPASSSQTGKRIPRGLARRPCPAEVDRNLHRQLLLRGRRGVGAIDSIGGRLVPAACCGKNGQQTEDEWVFDVSGEVVVCAARQVRTGTP